MFTILPRKSHAERKRTFASLYSKSYIKRSRYLQNISNAIISGRTRNQLHSWARDDAVVEVLEQLNRACLTDFTTAWLFGLGNGTNFLEDRIAASHFFSTFRQGFGGFLWRSEFHEASKFLQSIGVHMVPQAAYSSRHYFQQWISEMCETAFSNISSPSSNREETSNSSMYPLVYSQLLHGLKRSGLPSGQLEAAVSRELLDHLVASHDATGTTLTFVMHELRSAKFYNALSDTNFFNAYFPTRRLLSIPT